MLQDKGLLLATSALWLQWWLAEWQPSAGWVARVGSACFLFVQMLMLLDFVTNWNDAWVDKEDDRQAH